ncbi:hypothetical protein ACOBRE_002524 [Listeria monocytogenes]
MSEQEAKQVVLEWLKINYQYGDAEHGLINELFLMISNVPMTAQENAALNMLSEKAEFELIAEFASWGLEEVGRMNDKKVRFYVSTGMHGSLETETFLLKADLNIEFDILTPEKLEKEITEAYDDWLGSNIDSGWLIEKEVAE